MENNTLCVKPFRAVRSDGSFKELFPWGGVSQEILIKAVFPLYKSDYLRLSSIHRKSDITTQADTGETVSHFSQAHSGQRVREPVGPMLSQPNAAQALSPGRQQYAIR